MMVVRPRDKVMYLELTRDKGAAGDVSCEVFITTDTPLLPGKAAKSGVDFEIEERCIVNFKAGESSQKLRINMPGTSVEGESEIVEEASIGVDKLEAADNLVPVNDADKTNDEVKDDAESVHFIVELRNPTG
jgi:hypothetical protein